MKDTTMYRTITATLYSTKGILCTLDGKETIKDSTITVLYEKEFKMDGTPYKTEDGSDFYPAMVLGTIKAEYKCTMTEQKFVRNAQLVESRFVNGRTRMVTRSVSSFSATCLCYDMEKQQMVNSVFSIPEDKGADKNLSYLKKHYEEVGKFIIATVLSVKETEGIYAMTERKFFELADRELVG